MNKKQVIDRLRNDEDYYGDFGQKYLSNSDISVLLKNPLALHTPMKKSSAFLVGGYFHTAILEPDKLKKYKVIKSTTRNTKAYKEISNGELCLLEHEVDHIEKLVEHVMENNLVADLIRGTDGKSNDYEVPNIVKLEGKMWKGKADIVNHNEQLIIDLKTTADITQFRNSAWRYNYDSQAYIYSKLFGYEMVFIVIDKTTKQIGVFDCSPEFYASGEDKVKRAVEAYDLFFNTKDFDPKQFFVSKTL